METRRDVFQAIADPTRRAILLLIATQSMTPNIIAEDFNTSRQAVSKHIKILVECEFVIQEKKGREIYYHINPSKVIEIDNWIEQFKKTLKIQFNQLDKVLLKMKKKND